MNPLRIEAGFATREYTPQPGLALQGQLYERLAESARDPLSANVMALRQGDLTVVVAALDVCVLEEGFVRDSQRKAAAKFGLRPSHLLIHAIHTHVAPGIAPDLGPVSAGFVASMQEKLLEAVGAALEELEPVQLHAGCGEMGRMGWNRRAIFENGRSAMYGHSGMPGFIGLEGPRDPALPVLFAKNEAGKIKGVLVNFASHPNCIATDKRYSADFPGEARRLIGAALGGATVVYLTGAAGDTAPRLLDPWDVSQPWEGEEGLVRSGRYLAGEALKVIAAAIEPMEAPRLQLEQATLEIPLRPWPKPEEPCHPASTHEYYRRAQSKWPELLEKMSPVAVNLNVLRMGDAVLCTNAGEPFVEWGLQIKAHSKAKVTFVAELSDGYVGYIPMPKAFSRGGYETWNAETSKLACDAGERIVEATRLLLEKIETT